jgi:threonine aldolase
VIDFRSDTLTQPTRAMRDAIANAVVGDEQKREDPTVNELERRGAEFLGHEEAVFLPTATMANQIALNILGRPGDAVLVEQHAHIMLSELGGPAAHSGLLTIGLPGTKGRFSPDQVVAEIRDRTSVHVAPTRVVTIENTHNSAGGRVWPLEEVDAIVATCREHDLAVHLDGARLVNAAIATGVNSARIGRGFDTVTLCFSKALGCPLGALIAGSAARCARPESSRRRPSTHSTTTSTELQRTMHALAASPWDSPPLEFRSISSRSRRTSCRSTSGRTGPVRSSA